MNYALALHTTTAQLGMALSNFAGDSFARDSFARDSFARDSRNQTWDLGRSMSTHLHQHLTEFLQPQTWSDLSFLAVAKGPGSFTSTRIGIVVARTLAQQLEIPLYAISSLAAFAWSKRTILQLDATEPLDLAVQMPAQRGELFVGIYGLNELADENGTLHRYVPVLKPLLPDTAMRPDQWQQQLANWERPYRLIITDDALGSSAISLLELAYAEWQQGHLPDWSLALPFYGQSSVI